MGIQCEEEEEIRLTKYSSLAVVCVCVSLCICGNYPGKTGWIENERQGRKRRLKDVNAGFGEGKQREKQEQARGEDKQSRRCRKRRRPGQGILGPLRAGKGNLLTDDVDTAKK